jgi:hypothetical protein
MGWKTGGFWPNTHPKQPSVQFPGQMTLFRRLDTLIRPARETAWPEILEMFMKSHARDGEMLARSQLHHFGNSFELSAIKNQHHRCRPKYTPPNRGNPRFSRLRFA